MSSSNLTVETHGTNGDIHHQLRAHYREDWEVKGGGISEIEEDFSEEVFDLNNKGSKPRLGSIREDAENSSVFSFDIHGDGDGVIYVVIGKEATSMDALIWALDNLAIPSSTVVFLIHIFPETKFIPTPLGKLPISQVNPEQKENHMAQERGKRRELLQKFLNVCSDLQVKVDTILIESDMEAKAILDLIPILNIRKLVLGTTRRMKSKKGNGVTDQILQGAPEFCDIKIVCEGKEMSELAMESPSPAQSPRVSSARTPTYAKTPKPVVVQDQNQITEEGSAACGCFKL